MKANNSKSVFGIAIIVIGFYFLGQNFNLFPHISIWSLLWPGLFMYWGYEALKKGNDIGGFILLIIGGNFLLSSLGNQFFGMDLVKKVFFPAIFILIGLRLIFRNKRVERHSDRRGISLTLDNDKTEDEDINSVVIDKAKYNKITIDKNGNVTKTSKVDLTKKADSPTLTFEEEIIQEEAVNKTRLDGKTCSFASGKSRSKEVSAIFASKKYIYGIEDFKKGDNFLDLTCIFGEMKLTLPKNANIKIISNVTLGELNFLGEKMEGFMSKYNEEYKAMNSEVNIIIYATVLFGEMNVKLNYV